MCALTDFPRGVSSVTFCNHHKSEDDPFRSGGATPLAQWEAEYRMDVNGEGLSADDADWGNRCGWAMTVFPRQGSVPSLFVNGTKSEN